MRNGSIRGSLTGVIIEEIQADNDGDGIPDATDPDDDNDGIPDEWEDRHELDSFVADASEDPDVDGLDNWSEYVADTDPQDSSSMQDFVVEPGSGSGVPTIRFSTSASRRYTVEYSSDLTSESWQPLAPSALGTGSEVVITDNATASRRFYRLVTELP